MTLPDDVLKEFARELEHWKTAVNRLTDLDAVAPPQAWQTLEHYLGVALRQSLTSIVERVRRMTQEFDAMIRARSADTTIERLQSRLVELRQAYLRAETAVDFYTDAIVVRSIPRVAALLRACDHIATRSMAEALTPMGREVPSAMTYIDRGLGASVLKAGLRLWDGTSENVVATIKVTRHNLFRPHALLHEAGHQVAHMLGWNTELAAALATGLGSPDLGSLWAGFASEVSSDGFAHVHTGFGAATALHDVLDGADQTVFQYLPGDPHPISFLRVLMVLQMCRRSFGGGPWDSLAHMWNAKHRLDQSPSDIRPLLAASVRVMPQIVDIVLYTPYRAFGGIAVAQLINPMRVSPAALIHFEQAAGESAFTSPYWAWNEAIRLLALNGYRAGLGPTELQKALVQQEKWMLRLGAVKSAA